MRQLDMFLLSKIEEHKDDINRYDLKWLLDESKEDAVEVLTRLSEAGVYPYSAFGGSKADQVWSSLLKNNYFDGPALRGSELQAFLKAAFSLGMHIFYLADAKALWWTSKDVYPSEQAFEIAQTEPIPEYPSDVNLPGKSWKEYGLDLSDFYDADGDYLETGDDMNGYDEIGRSVDQFLEYNQLKEEEVECPSGAISNPGQQIKLPGPVKY